MAVGDDGRGAVSWYSIDGLTWHSMSAIPDGGGARMTDIAWDGDTTVAVGTRGPDGAIWIGKE
jgi:hypothetical protein